MLKRNQIMITALAIMIAVAGYLNFAGTKAGRSSLRVRMRKTQRKRI